MTDGDTTVRAAGGVVVHEGRILIIHRQRYDDWSLPKGKLDPGESWEQAAVREVHEETGVVPVLGDELDAVEYTDHRGRPKTVRFWAMTVAAAPEFVANDEVDAIAWVDGDTALQRLTYGREASVVATIRDRLA